MADVPEDAIARRVEQAVQGDGDFAASEVGPEVAADLADHLDDVGANLFGDLLEFLVGEVLEVPGAVDAGQEMAEEKSWITYQDRPRPFRYQYL